LPFEEEDSGDSSAFAASLSHADDSFFSDGSSKTSLPKFRADDSIYECVAVVGVSEAQSGSEEVVDLAASTVPELSPFILAAGAEFSVTEGSSRTCTVGVGSGAVVGIGLEIPVGPCPAD
jgi:hypothetical protein